MRLKSPRTPADTPAEDCVADAGAVMDGQRLDILLVEDNPGQARLVGETLADGGLAEFALDWVSTLGETLGRLETGGFDVALVDLTLPDSDGLATVRRMRARAPRLPMVVLTGLEGGATGLEALQAGAQERPWRAPTTSQASSSARC